MTVLVDPAVWPWRGERWSHLVSDVSYDELHAFAAQLGVPRRAFQGDHYDVPEELYESLKVDGGGIWRSFFNITLPYLRNTIVSVVVVLLMLYVQMVTIILVTTRGGPLGATETLSMSVYNQTFVEFDLSGASATAMLLFAINIVLTLVAIRFRRKETL